MDTNPIPIRHDAVHAASAAGLDRARDAARAGRDDEAGRAFERLFASLLVRELRRALPEGPFGGGAGADVYEAWFDDHLGGALADRGALGIAGMVRASLGREPAATPDPAPDAPSGGGES